MLLGLLDLSHFSHAVFVEVELLSFYDDVRSDVSFLSNSQEGLDALAVVTQRLNEVIASVLGSSVFHF